MISNLEKCRICGESKPYYLFRAPAPCPCHECEKELNKRKAEREARPKSFVGQPDPANDRALARMRADADAVRPVFSTV